MSDRAKADMVGRRGELLAELFLQDLGAEFVAKPMADLGYDFFVGFNNPDGGVNIAAVEVKATDKPVHSRYRMQRRLFRRLANSNIPVLLLVVNVKQNQVFYALPGATEPVDDPDASTVSLPVMAVDEATKHELRDLLTNLQGTASEVLH
jgi:Domain of unknown function (DUF4365)